MTALGHAPHVAKRVAPVSTLERARRDASRAGVRCSLWCTSVRFGRSGFFAVEGTSRRAGATKAEEEPIQELSQAECDRQR